jgi:hypothetical protein
VLYLAPLAPLATLIALAAADGAAAQRYVPFMQPLPAWDVWYLLALPLCAAVSIVYKSIRCRSMRKVPREAAKATGWIILGLVAAAIALALIVEVMERVA